MGSRDGPPTRPRKWSSNNHRFGEAADAPSASSRGRPLNSPDRSPHRAYRPTPRAPVPPSPSKVQKSRYHRLIRGERRACRLVDMPKLRVTVRMILPLPRLGVRVQPKPKPPQELPGRPIGHLMSCRLKRTRDVLQALRAPPQRRARIPRVSGSTNASNAPTSSGSDSVNRGRPAPGRRTRPASSRVPSRSSAIPRCTVFLLIPVARTTAAIPPGPHDRASDAAHNLR